MHSFHYPFSRRKPVECKRNEIAIGKQQRSKSIYVYECIDARFSHFIALNLAFLLFIHFSTLISLIHNNASVRARALSLSSTEDFSTDHFFWYEYQFLWFIQLCVRWMFEQILCDWIHGNPFGFDACMRYRRRSAQFNPKTNFHLSFRFSSFTSVFFPLEWIEWNHFFPFKVAAFKLKI